MFESSDSTTPGAAARALPAASGAIALHGLIVATVVLISVWQLPVIVPPDLGIVLIEGPPPYEEQMILIETGQDGGGRGGGSRSAGPPPPAAREEQSEEDQAQAQQETQPRHPDPAAPVAESPAPENPVLGTPDGTGSDSTGIPGGTGDPSQGSGDGQGGPGTGPGRGTGEDTGVGSGPGEPDRGRFDPPALLTRVEPVYPAAAIKVRREGTVLLEVTVTPDGLPGRIEVLRHDPLLERAAVEAVKQWRWKPAGMTGRGVSVVIRVEVSFQLR